MSKISLRNMSAAHLNRDDNSSFAGQRDKAIAGLIDIALQFPTVNRKTGYPFSPINTLSRLAGLLYCRKVCRGYEDLEAHIKYLGSILHEQKRQTDKQGYNIDRYMMVRHAQTGIESVKMHMVSLGFRLTASQLTSEEAQRQIDRAEKIHIPNLLKLAELENGCEQKLSSVKEYLIASQQALPG